MLVLALAGCGFDAAIVVHDDDAVTDASTDPNAPCDDLSAVEGAYIPQESAFVGTRAHCASALHASAGASGSTLRVTVEDWDGAAELTFLDLLGQPIGTSTPVEAGDEVEVDLEQSGEVLFRLDPADPDAAANPYTLRVSCVAGCDRQYTRYPIVLLHGAAPSEYVGLMNYFFGVVDDMSAKGFLVLAPKADPWAGIDDRAGEFYAQIAGYAAEGKGRRFNLIGHSQGGLDARYVASVLDDDGLVASVTTLASPHHGAPMADVMTGAIDLSPFDGALVDAAADAAAFVLGEPNQDAVATLQDLSTASMADFDDRVPDVPGVPYWSWSGHSCAMLDWGCQQAHQGEVIAPYLDPTFQITLAIAGANDGMVPVESAKWGTWLGEVSADHMDEVGQIADLGGGQGYDHKAFFRGEAARLFGEGL